MVQATWDDVPHLTEQAKNELLASIPAYQRDARTKGIPQLGSGAIYPVPESDVLVQDFELPEYYPRVYALDVGWNRTAALWGARDNESGIVYLYSEYYKSQAEPVIHAQGIKSRGDWIPGVIDPASRGRSQFDGLKLIQTYRELGLTLTESKNAVEAGIYETWQLLANGKLKVFKSLVNWLMEFRIYQRREALIKLFILDEIPFVHRYTQLCPVISFEELMVGLVHSSKVLPVHVKFGCSASAGYPAH